MKSVWYRKPFSRISDKEFVIKKTFFKDRSLFLGHFSPALLFPAFPVALSWTSFSNSPFFEIGHQIHPILNIVVKFTLSWTLSSNSPYSEHCHQIHPILNIVVKFTQFWTFWSNSPSPEHPCKIQQIVAVLKTLPIRTHRSDPRFTWVQ